MPPRKRLPLGLIPLPSVDILVDPETNMFMELTDAEGTLWMDLIGRNSRRLLKKDIDNFFRRAHELGIISDERFQEIADARRGIPMPTIHQYKNVKFGIVEDNRMSRLFPSEGKLRPN